jgi:DNA-binding transcriptional LysR family regulator
MQNWQSLIYCLALAEYKTMSKAAKALRTNATTVSRHINNLAETYQKPIFVKNGQEWTPTEFGQQLVEIAKNTKTNIDEIETDTSTVPAGTLRIYSEMRLMQAFFTQNWRTALRAVPNIKLHISINPSSLAFGEVDMTFTCEPPNEGRLVRKKVASTEYAVFANKTFFPNLEGWIELIDQPGQKIDQSFLKDNFDAPPRIALQGLNMALKAIQELPYMVMLPRSLASQFDDLGEVPNSPVFIDSVWASCHESRRNDPIIRSVFNWLETIK